MTKDDRVSRLRKLTSQVVDSYRQLGDINLLGEKNLPSQKAVANILQELLAVIFPGYHGDPVFGDADLELLVGGRLDRLNRHLTQMVEQTLVFCFKNGCHCPSFKGLTEKDDWPSALAVSARQISLEYLEQLPEIRRLLDTDVTAAYEGDPAAANTEEIILCYPGVQAIAVHRLAHPLFVMGVPLLPRIMNEWAHQRTGVDIHPGATIGEYFFIDHGTGVVIGETTLIGNKVKVYQSVTLGALSFNKNQDGSLVKGGKRHPTLEDEVTIYANATILGGETVIGRKAVVGGGTWITKSVAPGQKVTAGKY